MDEENGTWIWMQPHFRWEAVVQGQIRFESRFEGANILKAWPHKIELLQGAPHLQTAIPYETSAEKGVENKPFQSLDLT